MSPSRPITASQELVRDRKVRRLTVVVYADEGDTGLLMVVHVVSECAN